VEFQSSVSSMKDDTFFSLARAFTHADIFFDLFEKSHRPKTFDTDDFHTFFLQPVGTFMLFWYATLYNVCEFLNNTHSLPDSIKSDFAKVKSDWQKCRHLTSHIKTEFFSDDNFAIFKNGLENYRTIKRIHLSLKKVILSGLATNSNPFRR
jgi:hypothetical protein